MPVCFVFCFYCFLFSMKLHYFSFFSFFFFGREGGCGGGKRKGEAIKRKKALLEINNLVAHQLKVFIQT